MEKSFRRLFTELIFFVCILGSGIDTAKNCLEVTTNAMGYVSAGIGFFGVVLTAVAILRNAGGSR